jgi:hypothetical protein
MRYVSVALLFVAMIFCLACALFLTTLVVIDKTVGIRPSSVDTVKDGSLLFWRDSLLVKPIIKRTGSDITHAAIILDGYVYEAVPPRVHKVKLADYIKEMEVKAKKNGTFKWFVVQPAKTYTTAEGSRMKAYAESQLGRRYMLRGYWKGHEVRGVFCSEYVGDTLATSGRVKAGGVRESPGSLYLKIKDAYQ